MTKYEDREWIIRQELKSPGDVGDVITFGMYPTYEEAMDIFTDLYPMGLKVWIERNTDQQRTPDSIIVSIKVRLGELDLDIHDAQKRLQTIGDDYLDIGYEKGILDRLIQEKETLEQIMRGEYGRK